MKRRNRISLNNKSASSEVPSAEALADFVKSAGRSAGVISGLLLQDEDPNAVLEDESPNPILQDEDAGAILQDEMPGSILQDEIPDATLQDEDPGSI